ncbi:MAG: TatD family hydrolase [Christensenellales bacterium]
MYAAVGVHPHDAKDFTEADIPQLTRWLTQEKKVKALGEIGLDYYYDLSPREIQKTVFERQLDLAYELKKPVILHIRDAHGDTIEILRAHRDRLPHCVVHCCSASWESAKIYLSLDCMISFAGPVTFKKSVTCRRLQKCAAGSPDDLKRTARIWHGTRSGHRNEPLNVGHICRLMQRFGRWMRSSSAILRGKTADAFTE